jgi:hypothetical protein
MGVVYEVRTDLSAQQGDTKGDPKTMRIVPEGSRAGMGGRPSKSSRYARGKSRAEERATKSMTPTRIKEVIDQVRTWNPEFAEVLVCGLALNRKTKV